jgi:probable rRNA maturation factor
VTRTSGAPAIELAVEAGDWPAEAELRAMAEAAVSAAIATLKAQPSPPGSPAGRALGPGLELSLLFTDDAAIQQLNARYRGKDKPTNVLSFPQVSGPLLGDIILAFETVSHEAALAEKPLKAHMAHLIVHGFLHLLGYDHEDEAEAETMEALERAALARIGIPDPYAAA